MRRPAAVFLIVLGLGAITLAPEADAWQPAQITACQTISQPGSYELVNNITATGDCLVITASFVTIDLLGFTITRPSVSFTGGTGILAKGALQGIAVRNGSISGFTNAVDLASADGSIVEGLRVGGLGVCPRS